MYTHLFATAAGRKGCILLFLAFLCMQNLRAQTWAFQTGSNLTTFDFTNSTGQAVSGIKSGSGNLYGIQFQQKLVDTSALLLTSSPWAIYFNQHSTLGKLLGKFQWALGIQYNQYNAVGDAVNVAFSYQTDYIGFRPSLQFNQPIYKNLSIQAAGILQVNQLLHGNQWVNNRFLDLKQDPQFNGIQTMAGFQIGVQQLISEGFSLSLSYQQMSTMQAGEVQGTHLVLRPNSFVFGIIFQPKNK